jgi:hypothetical protein
MPWITLELYKHRQVGYITVMMKMTGTSSTSAICRTHATDEKNITYSHLKMASNDSWRIITPRSRVTMFNN